MDLPMAKLKYPSQKTRKNKISISHLTPSIVGWPYKSTGLTGNMATSQSSQSSVKSETPIKTSPVTSRAMRGQSSTSLSNRSANTLKDHQGARNLQRPQLKDIKDTKVCPGSMCRKWSHLTASLLREMAATCPGGAILCRQHPIIFRG